MYCECAAPSACYDSQTGNSCDAMWDPSACATCTCQNPNTPDFTEVTDPTYAGKICNPDTPIGAGGSFGSETPAQLTARANGLGANVYANFGSWVNFYSCTYAQLTSTPDSNAVVFINEVPTNP